MPDAAAEPREGLVDQLGVDLLAEFQAMTADAHAFLDRRGAP